MPGVHSTAAPEPADAACVDSRLKELFSEQSDVGEVFIEHLTSGGVYWKAVHVRATCKHARAAITRERCYAMAERWHAQLTQEPHMAEELLGRYFVWGRCLHGLEWLRKKQPSLRLHHMKTLVTEAVRHKQTDVVHYLIGSGVQAAVDESTVAEAVKQGDGGLLVYFHTRYPNSVILKPVVTNMAVIHGRTEMLDFLDSNGYPHASPFNGFKGLESARARAAGFPATAEWLEERKR